jgi:hypothetical protein
MSVPKESPLATRDATSNACGGRISRQFDSNRCSRNARASDWSVGRTMHIRLQRRLVSVGGLRVTAIGPKGLAFDPARTAVFGGPLG